MSDWSLTLGVRGKSELARHGWTSEEVERLCTGKTLDEVLAKLRGANVTQPVRAVSTPRVAPPSTLLELVTRVTVPALPAFSVGDHFKVTPPEERGSARVPIAYVGSTFSRVFGTRVEPAVGQTALRIDRLLERASDERIKRELGGEGKVEATLGQMLWLMEQSRGGGGPLRTDEWWNLLYPADAKGWVVYCYWYSVDGGWYVGARSTATPGEWAAGCRVVSHNSDSPPSAPL